MKGYCSMFRCYVEVCSGPRVGLNGHQMLRVPTDTGKPGIPGKMRQLFPVREKSGNFEKMSKSQGKVREF